MVLIESFLCAPKDSLLEPMVEEGLWLRGRGTALYVEGPRFNPQNTCPHSNLPSPGTFPNSVLCFTKKVS